MSLVTPPLKSIIAFWMETTSDTIPTGWVVANGQTLTNPNSSDQSTWQTDIVGQNATWTTPDMRNRFIMGANLTTTAGTTGVAVLNANINLPAGAPGPTGTGGSHVNVLTSAQMPAHNHTQAARTATSALSGAISHAHTTNSDGSHNHGGATGAGGDHAHSWAAAAQLNSDGAGTFIFNAYNHGTTTFFWRIFGTGTVVGGGHWHDIATDSHTHTHTGAPASHVHNTTVTGGSTSNNTGTTGNAHDSRPLYIAMVYLIKVKH